MGKIYVNQSSLTLTAQTGVTLTDATTKQIKYIKPDGTTGSFDAVIEDAENLVYDFAGVELDTAGLWTFWAYVVFSDGRNAPGEPFIIQVFEQGK